MRVLVGLLISGTLLAACSGGTSTSAPKTTASPSTPTASPSTATSLPTSSTAGWVTYTGAEGLEFQHPASWIVEHGTTGALYVFIDPASGTPFRRNVNLVLQSSATPLTAASYLQTNLEQISQDNGTISQQNGVTFSGAPGYRVIWSATETESGTSYDLEFLSQWTLSHGDAWLLTYTADQARFGAALPMVESLVASLKLPT